MKQTSIHGQVILLQEHVNRNEEKGMLELVRFEDNFVDMYQREPRKLIVYGAGNGLNEYYDQIPKIDYICDQNASEIKQIHGKEVRTPDVLKNIDEKVYIVVSIINPSVFEEVCTLLESYSLDAKVVHLFNNIAFGYSYPKTPKTYRKKDNTGKIRINIVCQEQTWIYKKFADKLVEYLSDDSLEIMVSSESRGDVDINHHIPCLKFIPHPNDTLMITHIDDYKKVLILKKQLECAQMGICMSKETVDKLVGYGIPRKKLCYINPAQDNVISPKKYKIGITHRCYDQYDLRKRTEAILEILEGIDSEYFHFMIMGSGWDDIVQKMKNMGFEVTYYNDFIYEKYVNLMKEIDYYLFIGMDEGSMGYLDALAAGAGTIVTPQGFHLDVDCEIDYPCVTVKQFKNAFLDLQNKRKRKVEAIAEWTWDNYAKKHLEIWDYILKRKELKTIYKNQMMYEDGIFSILLDDCRV